MNAIIGALNIMANAVDHTIPAHIQQSANKISFISLDEPVKRDCPECKGEGEFPDISLCCGATRDTDTGLCSECHEDHGACQCDDCKGTGKVIVTDEELEAEAFFSRVDNFRNE